MPDLSRTISIIFNGDDNLSPAIQKMGSALNTFDAGIQGIADPVANFTTDLLKVETALAAMALAMTGLAVNEAGKLQTSITEIGTLFNATSSETETLRQSIKDYARDSSSAIDDINTATYIAISTGTEWTEVTTALASAEQLAVAGATTLAAATGALSRTMNAYGLDVTQAQQVSEALFTAVQNGDTTMEALASNLGKVATTAKGAGVDLTELLSAMAGVTVAGISTAEASTTLNALFKELATPSKELKAALGGMSLETNSLQEIMNKLKGQTGGTLEGFNKLFPSIEASKAAMILANDEAGAFDKTLKAMEERTGKLSAAYKAMSETFEKLNQNLVNNLKVTLIDVGEPLLESYGTSVKALSAILSGFGSGLKAPNFTSVYTAINTFVKDASLKMEEIAEALPEAMSKIDFSDLVKSFEGISEEVGNIFDTIFGKDLDLTKPEDLAQALQKGVNILSTFASLTTGILEGLKPIFDVIGEAGNRISGTSDATAEATGKLLGTITLLGEFGTILGGTLSLINEAKVDIVNVFAVIEGASGVLINALQIAFDTFVLSMAETSKIALLALSKVSFGDVSDGFKKDAEAFEEYANGAAQNLEKNSADMSKAWNTMSDGFTGEAANKIKKAAEATKVLSIETEKESAAAKQAAEDNKLLAKYVDQVNEEASKTEALESLADVYDKTFGKEAKIDATTNAIERTIQVAGGHVKVYADGTEVFIANAKAKDKAKDSTKALAKEEENAKLKAEEMAKAFLDLEIKLEEVASNERIKTLEFKAEIEVAKIEADMNKVVAAFDSLGTSVGSTNDALGTMFGALEGASRFEQLAIWDAIETQQSILKQFTDAQVSLIDAQVRQIDAQIERQASGTSTITVDGGELQPELETLMQSLFRSIRIEAAGNYDDFLLTV